MSSSQFLGHKRNSSLNHKNENEKYKNEKSLNKINLLNYTIEDIKTLNKCELLKSWDISYKSNNKLPLKDEKYKIKKIYSKNIKLFHKNNKQCLGQNVVFNNDINKYQKDYISHCLGMTNYSIENILEINQLKNINFKKFNLILDIDSTMIKAVELNEIPLPKKETDIQIKGFVNNNIPFEYYCRYRPYLFHFITEIKNYFNFYVSTLGHTNYANKILEDFQRKANIYIPQNNIISNKSDKSIKNIKEIGNISKDENELNNTIIFDDIVNFWIKPLYENKDDIDTEQCIKCLIPSKRYIINSPNNNDMQKFGILIHNDIFEKKYDKKNFNYSIDVDYQFCVEKDSDSENGKKGQFYYITEFIKKCIRYSMFSGTPLVNTMDYYRKKVFENLKFNLKYLGNEWSSCINKIIKELGGEIVISLEDATHFIIENNVNKKNILKPKNSQKLINLNYIFQCYFNLFRMNENEKQFKN